MKKNGLFFLGIFLALVSLTFFATTTYLKNKDINNLGPTPYSNVLPLNPYFRDIKPVKVVKVITGEIIRVNKVLDGYEIVFKSVSTTNSDVGTAVNNFANNDSLQETIYLSTEFEKNGIYFDELSSQSVNSPFALINEGNIVQLTVKTDISTGISNVSQAILKSL